MPSAHKRGGHHGHGRKDNTTTVLTRGRKEGRKGGRNVGREGERRMFFGTFSRMFFWGKEGA